MRRNSITLTEELEDYIAGVSLRLPQRRKTASRCGAFRSLAVTACSSSGSKREERPMAMQASAIMPTYQRAPVAFIQSLLRDLILTLARLEARLRDITCYQLVDVSQPVRDIQIVGDQGARLREVVLLIVNLGKQQGGHRSQR